MPPSQKEFPSVPPARPTRTKKGTEKEINQYWDEQAKAYKNSQFATNPDVNSRDLEIRSILAEIPSKSLSILDVGCGNGFSTIEFAKARPKARVLGVDFSKEMIKCANDALQSEPESLRKRVRFQEGDVRILAKQLAGCVFDSVISERCLINLSGWDAQRDAILQLRALTKSQGRLLLAENTEEGLERLNSLRKMFDLPAISIRWHNQYLPEKKLISFLKRNFSVTSINNYANIYYIISRVVYASLSAREGREPRYDHPINEIASRLPSLGSYHWSPCFLFVLKKK